MRKNAHFQPVMDKNYLIDDLNDFLAAPGCKPIEYDTRMTVEEIQNLHHAFEELAKLSK